MEYAKNSIGRSTGRKINMAAIKREFMARWAAEDQAATPAPVAEPQPAATPAPAKLSIAQVREVIERAQYAVRDLQGHTAGEFARANVPAIMGARIAALDALVIAPRFARDIERLADVRGNCERQLARWTLIATPAAGMVQ